MNISMNFVKDSFLENFLKRYQFLPENIPKNNTRTYFTMERFPQTYKIICAKKKKKIARNTKREKEINKLILWKCFVIKIPLHIRTLRKLFLQKEIPRGNKTKKKKEVNKSCLAGTGWESLSIRGLRILNNWPAPMIFSEQPTARLNWFASYNAGGEARGCEGLKGVPK